MQRDGGGKKAFKNNKNYQIRIKIQAAVLKVFSENEFHKVTMREISNISDVSLGTIYSHFGSKENLLFSFLGDWMENLSELVIDQLQAIENIKDKFRKIFWTLLHFYEENPEIAKIVLMTVPYKTWMSDNSFKQTRMIHTLIKVIKEGQRNGYLNNDVEAGIILDFILGLVRRLYPMWIYRGEKANFTNYHNIVFEMIWRAISCPEKSKE